MLVQAVEDVVELLSNFEGFARSSVNEAGGADYMIDDELAEAITRLNATATQVANAT